MIQREISFSTSSDQTIQQIRAWIRRCVYTHTNCKQASRTDSTNTSLPSRLLSIGDACIRVTDTTTLSADTTYTTLSHCWGREPAFKLTQSSLQACKDGISLAELPQTFQDAVCLARTLGSQYLWIDALCIIQDSPEDWRAEASRMTEVYANSALNIAAMAARNSHRGLFRSRNPLAIIPCKVKATWNCYKTLDFFIAPNLGSLDEAANLPLNRRGWVLQERLLSPKVISFGPQQVYWTCRTTGCSETFPEGELLPQTHLRKWMAGPPSLDD